VGTNGLFARKSPQSGVGFPVCVPGRPGHLQNGLFGRNDLTVARPSLRGTAQLLGQPIRQMAAGLHFHGAGMTKSLRLLSHLCGGDSSNPSAYLEELVFFMAYVQYITYKTESTTFFKFFCDTRSRLRRQLPRS